MRPAVTVLTPIPSPKNIIKLFAMFLFIPRFSKVSILILASRCHLSGDRSLDQSLKVFILFIELMQKTKKRRIYFISEFSQLKKVNIQFCIGTKFVLEISKSFFISTKSIFIIDCIIKIKQLSIINQMSA